MAALRAASAPEGHFSIQHIKTQKIPQNRSFFVAKKTQKSKTSKKVLQFLRNPYI